MFLRTKIHSIALIVLVLSIITFAQHGYHVLQKEVGDQEKSLLENHQQTISDLLSFEFDRLRLQIRRWAVDSLENRGGALSSEKLIETYGSFDWLARIGRENASAWQIQSLQTISHQDSKGLSQNSSELAKKINEFLAADQLSSGVMAVVPFGEKKEELVVVLPIELRKSIASKGQVEVFVAALRPEVLDRVMAFFSRQEVESLLVTEGGQVVFGRPMISELEDSARPDIETLVSQKKYSGQLNSTLSKGQSLTGVYKKLQDTNLYVLTSKASVVPGVLANIGSFGLLLLICAVLSMLVLLAELLRPYFAAANSLLRTVADLAQGDTHAPIDSDVSGFADKTVSHLKMIQNRLLTDQPVAIQKQSKAPEPEVRVEYKDNSEQYKNKISEFVAPMTAIHGFARKGKITRGSPETKEIFESIVRESESLQKKLKQVLVSEKVGSEGLGECNLIDITNSAIGQLESEIRASSIIVNKEYNSVPAFEGMPVRLQAAIVECLRNCVNYAAEASKKEVLVELTAKGQNIALIFTDWGQHDPLKETDGEKIIESNLMSILGTLQLHDGQVTVDYSQQGRRCLSLLFPIGKKPVDIKEQVILSSGSHSMPRLKKADTAQGMPEAPIDSDWDEEDGMAETEEFNVREMKVRKKTGDS